MNLSRIALLTICLSAISVVAAEPKKADVAKLDKSWVGIYTSTSEVGTYTDTVLAIEEFNDELKFRMQFSSCGGKIEIGPFKHMETGEEHGTVLTDGDKLYVPSAHGYYYEGKPKVTAGITRYTRMEINGRKVLLRDDALKAFKENDKLYDYGVLIKVADDIGLSLIQDLTKEKHESIEILYKDIAKFKGWKDPFTNGPNSR
ncbi:MAG: hypothetical protein SGJ20_09625 [Planctomycetota bacterium]|nr:hypothetical protein [Planctomycetota bacterium]